MQLHWEIFKRVDVPRAKAYSVKSWRTPLEQVLAQFPADSYTLEVPDHMLIAHLRLQGTPEQLMHMRRVIEPVLQKSPGPRYKVHMLE
jgi:hypothetical protein